MNLPVPESTDRMQLTAFVAEAGFAADPITAFPHELFSPPNAAPLGNMQGQGLVPLNGQAKATPP